MRKIKIYSTTGGLFQVETDVTTWGELKTVLANKGIDYAGRKAVESKNNTTLEKDEAILFEGEFMIMLTPEKTKSGAEYKEIRTEIANLISASNEAKEFFNAGKNYTNKSKDELERLLNEWKGNNQTTTSTLVEYKEEVKPVVMQETLPTNEVKNPSYKPTLNSVITAILALDEYSDNQENFDLAIELLKGEQDAGDIKAALELMKEDSDEVSTAIKTQPAPTLTDEERAWIDKMR